MAKTLRTFTAGRMNKVVDERLIPDGEYIDALNIRMGSPEGTGSPTSASSSIGIIENSKGNEQLTTLTYINNIPLSSSARCIGAIEDTKTDTVYWFVHDPAFISSPPMTTGKVDMIVSYSLSAGILTYHVVCTNDGGGVNTTLNFNPSYLITGVNIIDDYLYWTDDYNPPRFININRSYANPTAGAAGIDYNGQPDILREALQVIKKPPVNAPTIQLISTPSGENFMNDRFISFAYRYRYADGEYSATSQWSDIAFSPKEFEFELKTWLNSGMQNKYNACIISYNSGGPLVVGVDLLFKESSSNIVKVIEKLDKDKLGLSDNQVYNFSFDGSKIFTILPDSELLRLYDNVPRLAKAQTIMGNRLMYGNYLEGYDLLDSNGFPTNLTYIASPISSAASQTPISNSFSSSFYNIDPSTPSYSASDSQLDIDLSGVALTEGKSIIIEITFQHGSFTGGSLASTTPSTTISFSFLLTQDYSSVYQMATSTEFQTAIGTVANIQSVTTACSGGTFTDIFNCSIPSVLGGFNKTASGIDNVFEPIGIITSSGNDTIGLQLPAIQFTGGGPTVYEYYDIVSSNTSIQAGDLYRSLHSNRGYEVGIVYMDEFARSTTALVSPFNTAFFNCSTSSVNNSIQVTIPITQKPPYWAKKYKFVIKSDTDSYETIYSNSFYPDPIDNNYSWFFLEGENAKKVEEGDRLIVKADASGPLLFCSYVSVILKEVKPLNFFLITPPGSPSGAYMKISNSGLDINIPTNNLFTSSNTGTGNKAYTRIKLYDSTLTNVPLIQGATVELKVNITRYSGNSGAICPYINYVIDKKFVSSTAYTDVKQWFDGDLIFNYISSSWTQPAVIGNPACTSFVNTYDPVVIPFSVNPLTDITNYINSLSLTTCDVRWVFYDAGSGQLELVVISGANNCVLSGWGINVKAQSTINIKNSLADTFVFETIPQDSLPDVFYENHLSFDIINGEHQGNIQNQSFATNQPAIVDTGFFNCFMFGNGVESYKSLDSIVGKYFNLGQRVTTVAAQDYKEARRYSDITYSGIYNNESNVNKLNEFNLGLLNFKALEDSFGRIFKMDGRETDVLVLQEDKISYVLAGKNLLSDAAAGSAITSVPEVLGTQIARVEKYGISFNPESYVHWGYDRYFTDTKRGAVIQLKGNSYSNDQIRVISEQGMRTWFRDEFNLSFNTQKLGGFDPYMNEYVLSTNDISIPIIESCLECGLRTTKTIVGTTSSSPQFEFCVDLGSAVGDVVISWQASYVGSGPTVIEFDSYQVFTTYNNNDLNSGPIFNTGVNQLTIDKNSSSVTELLVGIGVNGSAIISLSVECPESEPMNIVEVVVTSNSDAGQTIHTEYRYVDGLYVSPTQTSFVTFGTNNTDPFVISRHNTVSGFVGNPGFPNAGSTMYIQTNKIAGDTFDFDLFEDKFRWYRSNTLYANNTAAITTLLAVSTQTALPIGQSGNVFFDDFTVPAAVSPPAGGDYLYLIWDLRESVGQQLCYTNVEEDVQYICCECEPCTEDCVGVRVDNSLSTTDAAITTGGECGATTPASFTIPAGEIKYFCVKQPITVPYLPVPPTVHPVIEILDCGCDLCEDCEQWAVRNITEAIAVEWIDCSSTARCQVLDPVSMHTNAYVLCARNGTAPIVTRGTSSSGAYFEYLRCDCSKCNPRCFTEGNYDSFVGSDQLISVTTDCGGGTTIYTVPAQQQLYLSNTVGITNFLVSSNIDLDGIAYSFYYDSSLTRWRVRFNYSCCAITSIVIRKGGSNITVPFSQTTCWDSPCGS